MEHINTKILNDPELKQLYQNDASFHAAINHGILNKLSVEDILIFALKIGYKEKGALHDQLIKHIQRFGHCLIKD
jgi:hypothetical protein